MQTVTGILLIAYVMGILPILLGIAFNRVFFVKKYELSDVYVKGYLILFATFAAEAVLLIFMGKTLSFLSMAWLITVIVLGILALVISISRFKKMCNAVGKTISGLFTEKRRWISFVLAVLLMVFSLIFVKPLGDSTVEYASAALQTDQMYVYHPYIVEEQYPQVQVGNCYAPFEMFYAIMASWTKIPVVVIVKWIVPLFLIPLFYAAVCQWAEILFHDTKKKYWFYLAIMALYTVPIYAGNDYLPWAILINSWNGLTLLNSIFLPSLVLYCFRLYRKSQDRKNQDRRDKISDALLSFALVVDSQLMNIRGGIFAACIILIWIVIFFISRVVSRYDTNH